MMHIKLPALGRVAVTESVREPGHFLWMSLFGWHDCTTREDAIIRESRS